MRWLFLIRAGLIAATLALPCYATLYGEFKSWQELEEKSPDIVLVECRATPKPNVILDGVIRTEIDALEVLKGNSEKGAMAMYSSYQPRQGERFLLFAHFEVKDGEKRHVAIESFRAIPLGLHFPVGYLKDKPLKDRVQAMLEHRHQFLENELKRLEKERERLQLPWDARAKAAGSDTAETGS